MADNEKHMDNDTVAIGALSPQSSESCSLPNTPISLDFDPMSFKLKESSPIVSPTDEKVINGLSCPNNGVQGTPLDLDYFETLNTSSQDRSLIEEFSNQPDIVSSSVLKGQEAVDTVDSGPHSPAADLLQVSASTIASEPIVTSSTESNMNSETEGKQCVIDSITSISNYQTSSLIELSDEENQEEQCSKDSLHDFSYQHESIDVYRNDSADFCLSLSDATELNQGNVLNKEELVTSEDSLEEAMNKQKSKKVEIISITKEVSTSYNEMNGTHEKLLNSRNAEISDDEGPIECPISVAKLLSQYVHHAEQGISQSPPKEIIDTGIDFESLKTSYTQHVEERRSVSPGRETIATGINIESLKSSFNRSQDYQSAPVEEVKLSIDKDQLAHKFNQESNLLFTLQDHHSTSKDDVTSLCKVCGKHVYQMEKIFAEKNAFHKSCFRCKECGKSLNVDTYFSNEGEIFCSPHFKLLFQPKARFEADSEQNDEVDPGKGLDKKSDMSVSENIPIELPADVVRSDTKAADGLEKIPDLSNIRSWFESPQEEQQQHTVSDICTLQRSESILARMAKYQSAASGEQENGHLSMEDEQDIDISITRVKSKEKIQFSEMSNLKNQWESCTVKATKDEKFDEQKEELQKLRKQMNYGKSTTVKSKYEKACQDAKQTATPRTEPEIEVREDISAKIIKEKFEKGAVANDIEIEKQEKVRKEKDDLNIFTEGGRSHDARNLFKQIDAAGAKAPLPSAKSPNKSSEPRRTREIQYFSPTSPMESELVKHTEISKQETVETVEVLERFKFFENFKEIPKDAKKFQNETVKESDVFEKEIPRDPNIVRSSDIVDDIPVTDTTRRMLDKFKALESSAPETVSHVVPKPVKRIVQPRRIEDNEPNHELERDPNIVKASYKCDDDIVIEADKAKSLRAKFENWESEIIKENKKNEDDDHLPQADIAKNLRAKFESIKSEPNSTLEKPKSKVNRFIQEQSAASLEMCDICGRRLYPMEKMETSGQKLHKNCFRCAHCSCILRLENYTTSGGKLYCTPHFKQLFISRGNYDEGFGREQHKEKWNRSRSNTPVLRDLSQNGESEYTNGETKSLLQGNFDQQVMA